MDTKVPDKAELSDLDLENVVAGKIDVAWGPWGWGGWGPGWGLGWGWGWGRPWGWGPWGW
jgi:hypothetical protein